MLATFAFDVCHDVYLAAREAIDCKIPTLNAEASGRYLWRPDRMPRLAEYVCDFALAGERALGANLDDGDLRDANLRVGRLEDGPGLRNGSSRELVELERGHRTFKGSAPVSSLRERAPLSSLRASPSHNAFRASRLAMFRLHYLGGAEYQLARRHMGISEPTWADWGEEIRGRVGRELMRAGMFPPSKYFREATERAS
jgi:hypothetical protein